MTPGPGVPVEQHLERVLGMVEPLAPVRLPLEEALGLVCAEEVRAAAAVPRFDHAAMDGYAVRAADVASADERSPVELPVVGVVAAGDAVVPALAPGTALRIMTGAPLPDGADLVVPLEWTEGSVRVLRSAAAGRHVRRAGEDLAADAVAVAAGTRLAPRHLGLLAAAGRPDVLAHPAPRVAIVATGAELVGADRAARAGQVADSNTVALAAAATGAGAAARSCGPVPDDVEALLDWLAAAAAEADLVVTTGGVSAGDHDVVKAALRDRDGFWFGSVAVRPGRPQGCGVLAAPEGRAVPMVALPGTPVAAYTSFCLFVLPVLRRLAGRGARAAPTLPLAADVEATDRTVVLPGSVVEGQVAVIPGHAGHSLRMLAAADALIVVPPSGRLLPVGTHVEVILLDPEDR